MHHPWFAWATLSFAATPLVGAAAPQNPALTPLRSLVYATALSAETTNEHTTSGPTASRTSDIEDTGTLTISVVAAPRDGGLVVDARFSGERSTQTEVRVSIMADGTLAYDARRPLSIEAGRVLPFLARGFVADRQIGPGATWTVALPRPAHGSTEYTVVAVVGSDATIRITSTIDIAGRDARTEFDRGELVYDTDRLDPKRYDVDTLEYRSPASDRRARTRGHLTARLLSDSFAETR